MKDFYGVIYRWQHKKKKLKYFGRDELNKTVEKIKERYESHIMRAEKRIKVGKNVRPIMKALLEDGFESFTLIIVRRCYSKETLYESEKYFIRKFKTRNQLYGYNIHPGGRFGGDTLSKHPNKKRIGKKISKTQILRKVRRGKKNGMHKDNFPKEKRIKTNQKIHEAILSEKNGRWNKEFTIKKRRRCFELWKTDKYYLHELAKMFNCSQTLIRVVILRGLNERL